MEYVFSKCAPGDDGTLVIPTWAVDRWSRQLLTPYKELPEAEKLSALAEADRMLAIMYGDHR